MSEFIKWWIKFTAGIIFFFLIGTSMNVPGVIIVVPSGWILISIFGAYNFYNRRNQNDTKTSS